MKCHFNSYGTLFELPHGIKFFVFLRAYICLALRTVAPTRLAALAELDHTKLLCHHTVLQCQC